VTFFLASEAAGAAGVKPFVPIPVWVEQPATGTAKSNANAPTREAAERIKVLRRKR
jgi:hypothetical protein